MGKLQTIAELGILLYEGVKEINEFFSDAVADGFYSSMDNVAFLSNEILKISSDGSITDGTRSVASGILGLSNYIVWGILLFYGFRSVFSYFLSKKIEIPWKLFIRMIVFGILANAAFFVCFTGVYFTENITEYIRSTVGREETSLGYFENEISALGLEPEDEEETDNYSMEDLMKTSAYFLSFLMSISFGARYIIIRLLILTSPVFFIFGGSKLTEKFFYFWCKSFFLLLSVQLVIPVVICISVSISEGDKLISQIILISSMILFCKMINFVTKKVLIN